MNIKVKVNNNDNLITIAYVFNTGSYNETKDTLGIAHFVEHLVFRGTSNRTSKEINRYIESFGGYLNAYTTYERTKFFCTLPSEYWKEGLDLINDICLYNTIPEDTFELEKNIVINELRMYEDDPENTCEENLFKVIFHNAFNRQLVGGTSKTVKNITREQVIDYIDTNFITDNLDIIITGGGNEEEIINYVQEILPETNNKKKEIPKFEFNIENHLIKAKKKDVQQSQIKWGLIGPKYSDEIDYIIFEMLTNYLGGNASSILYDKIRDEQGLVYIIKTSIQPFNDYSLLMGYASLSEDDIEKVIKQINQETRNLKLDEKSLEFCKNYSKGNLYIYTETTLDINEYYVLNNDSVEDRIKKIESITLDDVNRVLNKYFKQKIVYSIITPE